MFWEWVLDFNSIFITGKSRNGGGTNTQLYCPAGSATASNTENYAAFMRFAFRGSLEGDYTVKNLGLRCAKDLQ
jgi:formylglycine-generating enzyme required for sulfatase activity